MSTTTAPATHTPGGTLIPLPPTGGTGTTTTAPATGAGSTLPATMAPTFVTGGTTSASRISGASMLNLGVPHSVHLPHFDGTGWSDWSGTLEAILSLYEADNGILHATCPAGTDVDEWAAVSRRAKAYLCLYIKPDVYSLIASEVDYPTFKDKWDLLCNTYSGASGSTTVFKNWIQLTQAHLNDSTPMAAQLAKLNGARVNLFTAGMGVSDTQYCLILLHALPTSYEVLASTILAAGTPNTLKHAEITVHILNEEGRCSSPSGSSLNTAAKAPIKASGSKGKKWDHSQLMCHYCNKKGHIQPDCRKKKKDEADKAKKGESSSVTKAANSHVLVTKPTVERGAFITEVPEDYEIGVAMYAAEHV
jgi:hypothetical protein